VIDGTEHRLLYEGIEFAVRRDFGIDFHVKHISGNKNGAADALSRCGIGPADPLEDENNADDYFDAKLYSIRASYCAEHSPTARTYLHEAKYNGDDLILGCNLETLQ